MTGLKKQLPSLLIALVVAAVYANTFSVPFLFDDDHAIVQNPHLRQLWPVSHALGAPEQSTVAGRPVVSLSLAINFAVSGLEVWSYHLVNLLLHLGSAGLLFGLLRRTPPTASVALPATLLWAVHPLLTESVTYVIQRTELLMAFFFLLTLYCVVRGWNAGAVVACALGMGSKEVMAVAPVAVWLYDRAFLAGGFRAALHQRRWLYAGLAGTWVILAASLAAGSRSDTVGVAFAALSPWHYALTQAGVIVHYLRLAVWPAPLVLDYDDWTIARSVAEIWPALVVVGGLLAVTGWALIRKPRWGFLGAWFFLILAPTSSVVPIASEIAAERRMYLPLIAVVLLLVLAGRAVVRRGGPVIVAVLIVALALAAVRRNQDYRSAEVIWRDTLEKRPGNARAHLNYGAALVGRGAIEPALTHYRQAVRLKPYYADARYNLGVLLAVTGDPVAAIAEFREAVRLEPGFAKAHDNLGVLLASQGRLDEALLHLEQAVQFAPDDPEAREHLARARAFRIQRDADGKNPAAVGAIPVP